MPFALLNPDRSIEDVVAEVPVDWTGTSAELTETQMKKICDDPEGHVFFKLSTSGSLLRNSTKEKSIRLFAAKRKVKNDIINKQMRAIAASQVATTLTMVDGATTEEELASMVGGV